VFLNNFHEAVLPLAGSRPAREKIVATALDYLTGLEAEVGDDAQFRADLAGAYERVADIQGNPAMPNLGQTDAALASLHKAVALREANLAASPDRRGGPPRRGAGNEPHRDARGTARPNG
jgi:hypothetical protein